MLPVITPPTLRCKYFQVAGKHFLCIEGGACTEQISLVECSHTVVFIAIHKNFLFFLFSLHSSFISFHVDPICSVFLFCVVQVRDGFLSSLILFVFLAMHNLELSLLLFFCKDQSMKTSFSFKSD